METIQITKRSHEIFQRFAKSKDISISEAVDLFTVDEVVTIIRAREYKKKLTNLGFPDITDFFSAHGQIWVKLARLATECGWSTNTNNYRKGFAEAAEKRGNLPVITRAAVLGKTVQKNLLVVDASDGIAMLAGSTFRLKTMQAREILPKRVIAALEIITVIQMARRQLTPEKFDSFSYSDQQEVFDQMIQDKGVLDWVKKHRITYDHQTRHGFTPTPPVFEVIGVAAARETNAATNDQMVKTTQKQAQPKQDRSFAPDAAGIQAAQAFKPWAQAQPPMHDLNNLPGKTPTNPVTKPYDPWAEENMQPPVYENKPFVMPQWDEDGNEILPGQPPPRKSSKSARQPATAPATGWPMQAPAVQMPFVPHVKPEAPNLGALDYATLEAAIAAQRKLEAEQDDELDDDDE